MTISSFSKSLTSLLVVSLPFLLVQPVKAAVSATSEVSAIQARGDTDITVRTASLSTLTTQVTAATHLTASQKASLVTEMQSEAAGLTTLKTNLDQVSTVATARTDFQNIFQEHYIYAFYLPRVNRIIAADGENDATALLTTLVTKLQDYITQLQAQGKDVTALQASLTDMQSKVGTAQAQSSSVLTSLIPLTATGYPGNRATIQAASTTLTTARASLKSARADAATIIAGIKALAAQK